MELRKAQEMGGGTILVSLPKDWVARHGIRRGSILTIEAGPDISLLIYPHRREGRLSREVTIPYPARDQQHMINELTGAYLLGYDVIRVSGKERIVYDHRVAIKNSVLKLVGLEILEEDAYSITAQFLLEPTTLDPEKVFRRMHMIVQGMHKDAITSLVEDDRRLLKVVIERDDEVDRLYFLLVRHIRSAVLEPGMASGFKLKAIDCLDYRVASNILEAIGDASVEMARIVESMPQMILEDGFRESLGRVAESLQRGQDLAVRAFINRDADDAREGVKIYSGLNKELGGLERAIPRGSSSIMMGLLNLLAIINRIGRLHIDIADLAVPMHTMVR